MRVPPEHRLLQVFGVLFATAGLVAWIGVAWTGIKNFGEVSAQSDEGGSLMVWAVTGTLLMILGLALLQVEAMAGKREEPDA